MDFESVVPLGQIAFETPGACCMPVKSALEAVPSVACSSGATSGAPMKAKPAERAVRISLRIKLVF